MYVVYRPIPVEERAVVQTLRGALRNYSLQLVQKAAASRLLYTREWLTREQIEQIGRTALEAGQVELERYEVSVTNETSVFAPRHTVVLHNGVLSETNRVSPVPLSANVSWLPNLRRYVAQHQNENRFARQELVTVKGRELYVPYSATVVGAGGIGAWVALLLAMSGTMELVIIDPDDVETSNLSRIPLSQASTGVNKAYAIAMHVETLLGSAMVNAIDIAHEVPKYLPPTDAVFDCTDGSIDTHRKIEAAARRNKAKYIRASYDGTHVSIMTANSAWGEDDGSRYTVIPSWVVPAVTAAALAVAIGSIGVDWQDPDFGDSAVALDVVDLFGGPVFAKQADASIDDETERGATAPDNQNNQTEVNNV